MNATQGKPSTHILPGAYSVLPDTLFDLGRKLREDYGRAEPFAHTVIDNLFPEPLLDAILGEFPNTEQIDWQRFENQNERKYALKSEMQLGNVSRHFIWELNSQVFISFLQMLTGITGLVPDPHLMGGGLHQIERGGLLKIHADFNHHKDLNLQRRINVLVYLNRDWKEEYGGHLELWNREMTKCVKKVLPVFNRCVVFSTTDFAYHGHPEPLTCPEGRSRKSIAMYYYTNGRPAEETSPEHSTLFQGRPGETVAPPPHPVRSVVRDFVPPIVFKAWRRLTGRSSE
ncbi:MAG TPA: 2OG-Fe(II) oxygenase [Planctomycetota bacterium]|nr:2OG-Fe(II) oxygenase [Planctomycetota bacterium]